MTLRHQQAVHSFDDPRILEIRAKTRTYVRDVALVRGDGWERDGTIDREEFRRLGSFGLLGLCHPVEFGGTALGPVASVAFAEEISRCTFSGLPEAVLIHTDMSSTHISGRGSKEQKERYLPAVIRGHMICAIAVTEPEAGSDVAGLTTLAERHADSWVLNGTKTYVTNALSGDIFIVAARTDATAKPSRGLSLFLVERNTPGVTVRPMVRKHGMLSSDIADLVFDDTKLSAGALIGEENRGFYGIMENFQNERLVLGAMSLGMGLQALDITVKYLKERRAFGGCLWDKQAVRHRIALLHARMRAVGALVYDTSIKSARGDDVVSEVSMVKALAGETLQDVVRDCLQFHGGYGYMHGTAIERLGRDARLMTIGGGATEVMLDEIAKRL